MSLREEHAPLPHLLHLAAALHPDDVIGSAVADGPLVLQVHPAGVTEMRPGGPFGVEDPEPLEESLHPLLAAAAKPAAESHVVLEARRQVAEHRIDLSGEGHQVRRPRGQHAFQTPVEVVERDVHVERATDVEADAQSVQLAHHEILEAAANELLTRAEDLGPDESRHVVDMHPGLGPAGPRHPAGQQPREAVFPRLMHHHVDALGVAIGEVGSLPGLEIQAPRPAAGVGMAKHLVECQVERGVGRVTARDALKPDAGRSGSGGVNLGLDVDVREHAVGHRVGQAKGLEHAAQGVGHRLHALRLARHRIGSEHHVAHPVGPAIEDLPADVEGVVGGRVGLEPRGEASAAADPRAGERIEDRVAHADELLIVHHPHDAGNHVAGKTGHDRLDVGLGLSEQEGGEFTDRPLRRPLLSLGVEIGRKLGGKPVGEGGMRVDVPEPRPPEQRAGRLPRRVVRGGDADQFVSLLERVGMAEEPREESLVPSPREPRDVTDQVVEGRDLGHGGTNRGGSNSGEKHASTYAIHDGLRSP